jgi:hydroxymethylglutaryl-CoA reductase (NADPH)
MTVIPPTVLKKLYVKGSLRAQDDGFAFDLKNLIAPATITSIEGLKVDGEKVEDSRVTIVSPSGSSRPIGQVSPGTPLQFPVGVVITLLVSDETLEPGQHDLAVRLGVKEIGSLDIPVSDTIA